MTAQPRNDKTKTRKKVVVSLAGGTVAATEELTEQTGRGKRKMTADADEGPNKARAQAAGAGRTKRKATAAATERSQKTARVAEARREAKRKRKDEPGKPKVTVVYVDNGKGGDKSIIRTVRVSSLMVDRVVGDRYEWRDKSYKETHGRQGQIFDDGG